MKRIMKIFGAAVIGANVAIFGASRNPDLFSDSIEDYMADNNIDPRIVSGIKKRNIRVLHEGMLAYSAYRTFTAWEKASEEKDPVKKYVLHGLITPLVLNVWYADALLEKAAGVITGESPNYYGSDNFMRKGEISYARFNVEKFVEWYNNSSLTNLSEREKTALKHYLYAHELKHADQQETAPKDTIERMQGEIDADIYGVETAQSMYPDVPVAQLIKYSRIWETAVASFETYADQIVEHDIVDHNTALALDAFEHGETIPDAGAVHEAYKGARQMMHKFVRSLLNKEVTDDGLPGFLELFNEIDSREGPTRRTEQMLLESMLFDLGRTVCGNSYVVTRGLDVRRSIEDARSGQQKIRDGFCPSIK